MAAMRANQQQQMSLHAHNNDHDEMDEDVDSDGRREKPESEWRDLVQKLREEKESQEAQYEEEFREFERMANEKVVQLEEYYVQQLQQKVQQQQQQPMQQQQQLPMNDEELANTKKKLQADFANLKFASAHDREQAKVFKKRTEANESKISAYNASFIELAEKLKQLNDDTKVLRKDKDKQRKKVSKLE